MRKSVSILLVSIYIVSCNMFDNVVESKIHRIENTKEIEITYDNSPFIFNIDDIKRTKNIKLTKEDKDKLVAFGANKYESALLSFYSEYDNFYETTITHYNCSTNASCKTQSFLPYKSKENYNNLIKELKQLVALLKESAPNYNPKILIEAIDKIEHCFKKTVKYNQTYNNYLIIDYICLDAFSDAINIAVTAYIDAFTSVAYGCSSLYFAYAVKTFADSAKEFATKKGFTTITPIACAFEAIVSGGNVDKAKGYAIEFDEDEEYEDEKSFEGKEFIKAIDALNSTYKEVTS